MKFGSANCGKAALDRQSGAGRTKKPKIRGPSPTELGTPRKNESQIRAGATHGQSAGEDRCKLLMLRNQMPTNDDLPGLTDKIAARLASKPEVLIIHPAELRVLRSMTDQELRSIAKKNGWRLVRRLGGRQIEFYNDPGARDQDTS